MKGDINKFKASLVMLTVSPLSLLILLFVSFEGESVNIPLICIAEVIFWGCMIAGYVLLAMINKSRKSKIRGKQALKKSKPGIVCFFSNRFAIVFDIIMGLSFILTVIFWIFPVLNCAVIEIFAVFLFSLHMHSIFNGVNYKYIKSISDKKEGE